MPTVLVSWAVQATRLFGAGRGTAGVVSVQVTTPVERVMQAMLLTRTVARRKYVVPANSSGRSGIVIFFQVLDCR